MPIAKKIVEQENRFQKTTDEYTFTSSTYNGIPVQEVQRTGSTGYYYDKEHTKEGIVIHHTAGFLWGDLGSCTRNNYHVSVAFVIGRNGVIYKLFDPKLWSGHIGSCDSNSSNAIDKKTIAIEISNLGYLKDTGGSNDEWLYNYAGSKYCKKSDKYLYTELSSPFRGESIFATYTDKQYESVRKIIGVLCEEFDIPKVILPEESRYEILSVEEAQKFKGITSHVNYRSTGKWDVPPHFEWNRVLGFNFPIDLGKGLLPSTEAVEDYFDKTEKEMPGGYFPIAANGTWHAGLHIHSDKDTVINSCSRGKIVAFRLGKNESDVMKEFGSTNFIVVKTNSSDKDFYVLYNHLNFFQIDEQSLNSKNINWIKTDTKTIIKISNGKSIEARTLPGVNSQPDSSAIGNIEQNIEVDLLGEENDPDGDAWLKVSLPDDLLTDDSPNQTFGYIFSNKEESGVFKRIYKPSLNSSFIAEAESGKIISCDIPVKIGEPIWTVGEYGDEDCRTSMVHWEIFSEHNFLKHLKDNRTVIDPYDDFNMDSNLVRSLAGEDLSDVDDIVDFYKTDENAQKLRSLSCRFVNEWQIKDLKSAVSKLDVNRISQFFLVDKIKPYVWYQDALDAGVDIPNTSRFWHFNPVQFISSVYDRLPRDSEDFKLRYRSLEHSFVTKGFNLRNDPVNSDESTPREDANGDSSAKIEILGKFEDIKAEENAESVWYEFEFQEDDQPFKKGDSGWMRADVLIPGTSWDWFIADLKNWEELNAHLSLTEKITILRQLSHSKKLKLFDDVIGSGKNLKKNFKFNLNDYSTPCYLDDLKFIDDFIMIQDYQRVKLKNKYIDIHHLLVGLDVLVCGQHEPRSNLFEIEIALNDYPLGSRYSAATWAGDIGAAVADCMLGTQISYYLGKNPNLQSNNSLVPSYVSAASYDNGNAPDQKFIDYYYESRVPEADLIGDIAPWSIYESVLQADSKTKLHEILKKFGEEFNSTVMSQARNKFIDYYSASIPDYSSIPYNEAKESLLGDKLKEDIKYFANVWVLFRKQSSDWQGFIKSTLFGLSDEETKKINYLTNKMYDKFIPWIKNGNY